MDSLTVKFFTYNEANSLLPVINIILEKINAEAGRLADCLDQLKLSSCVGLTGRKPMKKMVRDILNIQQVLNNNQRLLESKGLILRNIDRGFIDFPTIIQGDLGYFSWRIGENSIEFWRRIGADERLPITGDLEMMSVR